MRKTKQGVGRTARGKIAPTALALGLALLAGPAWAADGFKAMAREFSRAAVNAKAARVAVLPFVPADGSSARDGWIISEKLTTQLVRRGQIQTVERSLLKQLMDEQRLARTGLVDPATIRELGKMLAVEWVVTGSYVTLGREVAVNARLVNVETGLIAAASEVRVPRKWFNAGDWHDIFERLNSVAPLGARAPAPAAPRPEAVAALPAEQPQRGRGCLAASDMVNGLEDSVLDLKARHWALQARGGAPLAGPGGLPGSSITDPELRWRLYYRIKEISSQGAIEPLNTAESRLLGEVDDQVAHLLQDCRLAERSRDEGRLARR